MLIILLSITKNLNINRVVVGKNYKQQSQTDGNSVSVTTKPFIVIRFYYQDNPKIKVLSTKNSDQLMSFSDKPTKHLQSLLKRFLVLAIKVVKYGINVKARNPT